MITAVAVAWCVFSMWMLVGAFAKWHDMSPVDAVRNVLSLGFWRTGQR